MYIKLNKALFPFMGYSKIYETVKHNYVRTNKTIGYKI